MAIVIQSVFIYPRVIHHLQQVPHLIGREILLADKVTKHVFQAAAKEVLLHLLHGASRVFGSSHQRHIAMSLALPLVFVEVQITFLVEYLQVGGYRRIGRFGLIVVIQYVPGSDSAPQIPQDVHDLKLHFRQCVVLASHLSSLFLIGSRGQSKGQHLNLAIFRYRKFSIFDEL